jgi:hypothetical protein
MRVTIAAAQQSHMYHSSTLSRREAHHCLTELHWTVCSRGYGPLLHLQARVWLQNELSYSSKSETNSIYESLIIIAYERREMCSEGKLMKSSIVFKTLQKGTGVSSNFRRTVKLWQNYYITRCIDENCPFSPFRPDVSSVNHSSVSFSHRDS